MSMNPFCFALSTRQCKRKAACLAACAFVILGASSVVAAAGGTADANARYQAERAVCNSGQSNQDRATCLKEAGAALREAKMHHLSDDQFADSLNASRRCDVLPADDRAACQRRIAGEGVTSGSVRDGGLIRELSLPEKK